MKYYLIAGERSGDLHASNLMKAILSEDSSAEFRYFGGDAMQAVGGTLVQHYSEMAFMGFIEVLMNLRKITRFLKKAQKDIIAWQPDVVILIDYAGFNLRIARFIRSNQLPMQVHYYISPKVWAWNTKRALKIKQLIDRMFVIFPFEVGFYQQFDYKVDYVGNPLMDAIMQFQPNADFLKDSISSSKPIIAMLPGSRKQEVKNMLSMMTSVVGRFPDYQFVIAGIRQMPADLYAACQNLPNVKIIYEQTYDLLNVAHAAIVTSGTATLETGLFGVPQIVVYKTSPLSYAIAKRLIKVPFISLVNLVAEKEVVRELIQKDFNTENLELELRKITEGGKDRSKVLEGYAEMKERIGEAGASQKAAKLMVAYLQANTV
jgi:lipid-A-disaccharide synthase